MSVKISSRIWDLRGIPTSTKLVILKLADNANDAGICWPSITTIAEDCELSERTVQAAIVWAERHHLIKREMRSGQSSIYTITPAEFAPPQNLHPAEFAPPPPQSTASTPAIHGVDTYIEPSLEEPSIEPSIIPDVVQAVSDFNALADRIGLPRVQKLSETRRKHLRARLTDCGGLEGWMEALKRVEAIPALRGQNKEGWRASFDFLIRESSFTKLMEGFYDGWGTSRKESDSERHKRELQEWVDGR